MIKIKDKLCYIQRYASAKFVKVWYWRYRSKVYLNTYRDFKQKMKIFEATLSLDDLVGWHGGNGGSLWLDSDKVKDIIGDGDYSFRYLFRRFGFPVYGCDSYKDITQYIINTPINYVKLEITVGGRSVYFRRVIHPDFNNIFRDEIAMFKNRTPPKFTYHNLALDALYATLEDLLKPVEARDIYLNINGEVEPKYDEDNDELLDIIAERSSMAGLGLGHGAAIALSSDNKKVWWELMRKIDEIGKGDFSIGAECALRILDKNNEE